MSDLRPWVLRIEGAPVAKPRMTRRDRWMPSKAVQRYFAWADLVKIMGRSLFKRSPLAAPVVIRARFFLPIPRSCARPERLRRVGAPHVLKPDIKNLIAGLEDALNGIAWNDDSQIVGYDECRKYWAHGPGVTVLEVRPVRCLDDLAKQGQESYPQGYPQEEVELSTGGPSI